jgi:hypothetical protein
MYIQALLYTCLFSALLVTPLANLHIFLICSLSQSTNAEIEYYFFVNISEAIILYLPECKMTLRHPPKKSLPRENVFIQA